MLAQRNIPLSPVVQEDSGRGFLELQLLTLLALATYSKKKKIGLGLSAFNDKLGPLNRNHLSIDLAYQLAINDQDLRLGLGIKLNTRSINLNTNIFSAIIDNDPLISDNYWIWFISS